MLFAWVEHCPELAVNTAHVWCFLPSHAQRAAAREKFMAFAAEREKLLLTFERPARPGEELEPVEA